MAEEWTCRITELASLVVLPTSATASILEGQAICLERARALVDVYIGLP